MKMERVILIMDNRSIFEIDAADSELKVKKLSQTSNIRLDIFITFQPDELVNQLGVEGVRTVDILDFECLDKQIRQSIGLEPTKEKWSVANMIATYLNKKERNWQEEEYEDLLKELTLCYRVMKERGKEEWKRITDIEIPVNKILYETQAKGIYFNHEEVGPLCAELHKKLYGYKNQIQLELNYVGDDLASYLNANNVEHHLHGNPSDTEIKNVCKQYPELEPFWKAKIAERNLKCLLMLSAINREHYICKPLF